MFKFGSFFLFVFRGGSSTSNEQLKITPSKSCREAFAVLFLSHSVMWRAHSRTYPIFVSGKHFMEVVFLGKRTRGSWHNCPGTPQLQELANTSKSCSPWNPWQNSHQGQASFWVPGLFSGLEKCLFRQSREGIYFPFFGNNSVRKGTSEMGKELKTALVQQSSCP